jgi:hypothetical protein
VKIKCAKNLPFREHGRSHNFGERLPREFEALQDGHVCDGLIIYNINFDG